MFFGGNNNNNDVVSTNTTICTWYSDLSSLTIGAWNDKINLRFSPSIGKDGNGLNQYDKERKANTALTQANAIALYKKIKKEIIPKWENKEDIGEGINVSVSMGKTDSKNIIMLEYKPDEEGKPRFYLTFVQNVPDTGIVGDESMISYKMNQTEVMNNYNPKTGEGQMDVVESEFLNFCNILERRVDLLPMTAHSVRHSKNIGKKYSNGNNNNNFSSNNDFNNFGMDSGMDELPFN